MEGYFVRPHLRVRGNKISGVKGHVRGRGKKLKRSSTKFPQVRELVIKNKPRTIGDVYRYRDARMA